MDTGRLMAGAGVGDLATNNNYPWFADKTLSPEKQAAYLDKLRRLREDLIHQESHILTDALERVRFQASLNSQVQNNMLRKNNPESVLPENPSVHKQLQEERIRAIEDRRKGGKKPELSLVEGKQLIKPKRNTNSPNSDCIQETVMSNQKTIGDYLIEKQKSRLAARSSSVDNTPQVSGRSEKSPRNVRNSLPPISDRKTPPRNGVFNSQMSMHKRNPNLPGVFQSTRSRTLAGNGPKARGHSFDFSPSVQGYDSDSHRTSSSSDSFEHYINNLIKYAQRQRNKQGKVYKGTQRQKPVKAYPPVSLNSSLSQGDCLSIVERENMPRYNGSIGDSDTISAPPATPTGHDAVSNNTEHTHLPAEKDSCVICNHPEIDLGSLVLTGKMVQMKEHKVLPQIPPKEEDSQLKHTEVEEHEQGEIGSVSPLSNGTPSPRSQVLLAMPDIKLLPPTPTPPTEHEEQNNNLQKAVSQNKLRKREVKNLLEDIKELNSLIGVTHDNDDQTSL